MPVSHTGAANLKETSPTMAKTVILGAARTPIGKMGGGLSSPDRSNTS
jgi:hypothetical protein